MYNDIMWGHIPSLDELSESVVFSGITIDINADLKNSDELLQYIKDFTAFYLEKINPMYISYKTPNDKYFRYSFDYNKIGINDYSDQYDGYGGYVSAGDYIANSDGYYDLIDGDKIIRINVLGKVYIFEMTEILKK